MVNDRDCEGIITTTKNLNIMRCQFIHAYTTDLHVFPTDIDECSGINDCQQLCQNTDGSYICSCLTGFVLSPNGMECNGELNGRKVYLILHLIQFELIASH